jgi:glutathione S-transferase
VAEIILHQYVNSPFSEKIRKIFAHKKVSWRAVEQPTIMPKPKLIPLTGGYRRIPVLQIGADIYSDTGIIIRKIDELFPEPTLYPHGLEAAAHQMNIFADRRMFWSTTPVIFAKLGASVPKEFIEDRSKMMQGADFGQIAMQAPDARNQLRAYLDMMDRQLEKTTYMLGESFSLADAALYHPVWFLQMEPSSFAIAQKLANLMRWFKRVDAMGHGDMKGMDPDEALKVARESTPAAGGHEETHEQTDDANGVKLGAKVAVTPDDYGFDPVVGKVVATTTYEIAIEREEPSLGKIVNHFPKVGFRISAA